MAEDDLMLCTPTEGNGSEFPNLISRISPESFGDTDSAIVAPPCESGSGSPESSRKTLSMSDGEERFESYGEEDQNASSVPGGGNIPFHRSPQPFQRQSTWLRTSLRRSPRARRRVPQGTQGNQLHRSSSFNGGHASNSSGESEEIAVDFSLEEDVIDLNQKVHMLQQQVSALADTRSSTDDKYGRVKQDNAVLQARVSMLEEQLREVEMRGDERLKEEQKRFREMMMKQDRDKGLEVETYTARLQTVEKESAELKEEVFRQRTLVEKLKQEKYLIQEQFSETEFAFNNLREDYKKMQELAKREREEFLQERVNSARIVESLTKELQDLQLQKIEVEQQGRVRGHKAFELPSRYLDLEDQLKRLKEENQFLMEAKDEAEAQLLNCRIQEGRDLLHSGAGHSLAAELEVLSRDEVMEALGEQREVNAKLRAYIDGILLNILDHYPALLEVKPQHRD